MVNLVLEFDDLHFMPPEDCMETIDKYVKAYPDIKLSFFTIPLLRGFPLGSNPEWCARLKEHTDWQCMDITILPRSLKCMSTLKA